MWSKVFSLGGTTTESPPTSVFRCHFLSPLLQEICPLSMYPSSHPLITQPVAGSLSQPVKRKQILLWNSGIISYFSFGVMSPLQISPWFLPPSLHFSHLVSWLSFSRGALSPLILWPCYPLQLVSVLRVSLSAVFPLWVRMPRLSSLFFNCTSRPFQTQLLASSMWTPGFRPYCSSNTPRSFRSACLCPGCSFYLDSPFLLRFPGT